MKNDVNTWGRSCRKKLANPRGHIDAKSFNELPPHTTALMRYASTLLPEDQDNFSPQGFCMIINLIYSEIDRGESMRDTVNADLEELMAIDTENLCLLHTKIPDILACIGLSEMFCEAVRTIFDQNILVSSTGHSSFNRPH